MNVERYDEALACHDRALGIAPLFTATWFNKALVEDLLGRRRNTVRSYRKFLDLAPSDSTALVARAQRRIRELQ